MNKLFYKLQLVFVFALSLNLYAKAQVLGNHELVYVSPKPNSYYNHQETSMIIKFRSVISESVDVSSLFDVTAAGIAINYTATKAEDGKTILLQPNSILPNDIKITVSLRYDLLLKNNSNVKSFSYDFYTTKNISPLFVNNEPQILPTKQSVTIPLQTPSKSTTAFKSISNDLSAQVPMTFPVNNQPNPAYYFISTITYNNQPNRCMILDNKGRVVYERFTKGYNLDFKMLTDTLISYYDWNDGVYYVLNTSFNVVDTVKATNGYVTDNHELQYDLKTGHYFILAQEHVSMNMQDSVLGGYPNANVLGLVIQEIDKNKNTVFEWHTLDYLPVTQCVGVNLAAANIDYIHCNSIDLDTDSTLILSSRHFNEIERINRKDGSLIWRFGNAKSGNQFTFLNDKSGFSYQHDARRLPNGNILLFDNGNYRQGTRFSRAAEYKLDEENLTATLVWQYRNTPDVVSDFMGSTQRMANGNTLIGWGGTSPTFTEVDSNSNKVFEVSMTNPFSYRAYKYENIHDIIHQNQLNISSIPDTLDFCNTDPASITSNISNTIAPYIPNTVPQNLVNISLSNSNSIIVATESYTNFYSYYNTYLDYDYAYLEQKDTTICSSSGLMKLSLVDNCKNIKYRWSTNDSASSIKINPLNGSAYYWVELTNGSYYKRDSIRVNVTGIPNFEILGQKLLSTPYSTNTYSVPFDPSYSYTWNIRNGNIIAGYNTNALTVQWGNKDSSFIQSTIFNQTGCSSSLSDVVIYQKNSGINTLTLSGNLSVYPNPVNDILNIESKDDVNFQLISIEGKLIIASDHPQKNSIINMAELASGYYLLNIISADKIERMKIIKN